MGRGLTTLGGKSGAFLCGFRLVSLIHSLVSLVIFRGNHFIMGGSVKGGFIHGDFPDDLTDQGSLNIGRGRLIPTTPWEGPWKGLSEWFGVTYQNLPTVLPNLVSLFFAKPSLLRFNPMMLTDFIV